MAGKLSAGLLSYNLQLFAKEGPGGEKTEPATDKKLSDARKEGQVAKSKDLGNGISLIALFVVLKVFISYIGSGLLDNFYFAYSKIVDMTANSSQNFTVEMMHSIIRQFMLDIILIILPVIGIGVIVAFLTDVMQVKWKVTGKPLMPKFNKINPVSGFKRIFSMRSVVELIKSLAIITLIVIMAYNELKDKFIYVFYFYDLEIKDSLAFIGELVIDLGLKLSVVLLFVGLADYLYQKYKFKNDMKMTKQEVKDEFKNSEGNPEIKGQIRRKMREASGRRMMQSVPEADVVITNPTHFAVAIKYEPGLSRAPVVVAKGEDYLARKIKEAAKEYDIEIVENKPLARALYYNVDLGGEIPPELYQAVAEVLAFVYKVKNKEYHMA